MCIDEVKAIVEIDKGADKNLKHLKVEYNLKDKTEAINLIPERSRDSSESKLRSDPNLLRN